MSRWIWTSLLSASLAHGAPLTKAWYLMRARANMKIHNYKAAIEAWQKVVDLDDGDREAQKELGVAYEKQGETDHAISQFDHYLAKYPDDAEVAFRQANYLEWSRYAYRRADAIRYYRMGLTQRDDPRLRHRLAKLLGQSREHLDEAVSEYQKLLTANPGDRTVREEYRKLLAWDRRYLKKAIAEYEEPARRERRNYALQQQYAQLLAADSNRREDAIAQYEHLFTLKRTTADELAYADLLAQSPATREKAAQQYGRHLGELHARLALARIRASRRETCPEAIEHYREILRRNPRHAEAHYEIAQAYAWLGQNDRAVYHTQLARQYGARETATRHTLDESLHVGRESQVGGRMRVAVSSGGLELGGYSLCAVARHDVGAFVTLEAEGGPELYAASGTTVTSVQGAGRLQYRISETWRVDVGGGYHLLDGSSGAFVYRGEVTRAQSTSAWRAGFRRELREDSLSSLLGARSHLFFAHWDATAGPWRLAIDPFAGWVSDRYGANGQYELDARGDVQLFEAGRLSAGLSHSLLVAHYDNDRQPIGGYFSPSLFFSNTPKAGLAYRLGASERVALEGGPSFQYQHDWKIGTELNLTAQWHPSKDLALDLQANYFNIASTYRRFATAATATYLF